MNPCRQMYADFAKVCVGEQRAFYKWVLANGTGFKGRRLTRVEEARLRRIVSKRLYTPKMCVLQSQVGACDGTLRYFEGQANSEHLGIPLEHAWLVDAEGNVWDATWKDGDDYFGVEIPTPFIRDSICKTGEADFLLGRYYAKITKNGGKDE